MTEITHTESRQPFERYPALASWIERLGNTPGVFSLGEWMVFLGALNQALLAARQDQAAKTSGGEEMSRKWDDERKVYAWTSSPPGGEQEAVAWRARITTGGAWVYCDTRLDAEGFAAVGGHLTGPEPLYASPVLDVEDQGAKAAWDWLADHRDLELDYTAEPEEDGNWRVFQVGGALNDQEWSSIATGETPLEAVLNARAAIEDHTPARSSRACQMDNQTPRDGGQWVPAEPTEAMKRAGCITVRTDRSLVDLDPVDAASVYRAMWAAAPQPPESGWRPTHRHVKRGTDYQVVAVGLLQTAVSPGAWDDLPVTIYRGGDGRWWVRPTNEFNDGRFEALPPPPQLPEGKV